MKDTLKIREEGPSIIGDVAAESVTVNTKGGSVSVILKRGIRGTLSSEQPCYGAKIELGSGVYCVLMAPGEITTETPSKIRVQKLEGGFMISLDDGSGEIVDPVTEKILALYEDRLKAGQVKVLAHEEAHSRTKEERAKVAGLLDRARANLRTPKP